MYDVGLQIRYISMGDHRTLQSNNVLLWSSGMTLEQYKAYIVLYADKSTMYLKDCLTSCASLSRTFPTSVVLEDDNARETYFLYTVKDM